MRGEKEDRRKGKDKKNRSRLHIKKLPNDMNRSLSFGLGAHGLILLPHFLLGGGHWFCPGLDQSKREKREREGFWKK